MEKKIKKCTLADVELLQELGARTFRETFGNQNSPEQMDSYVNQAFSLQRLGNEINNPESSFYMVHCDMEPAGYLKINIGKSQSEPMGIDALEIERVYILSHYQRQGLGKVLITHALEVAAATNKTKVWLGVWENNTSAISFYSSLRFFQEGTHDFHLGDEKQTDWLMVKTL